MKSAGSLLTGILEPLAPDSCVICALPGPSLCASCRDRLVVVPPPLCERCGHPWSVAVPRCRACAPALPRSRAALVYDEAAQALISAFKDRHRTRVAEVIADLVDQAIPPPPCEVLVPVPIGRARRAERGFNQSELLARALGRRWGRPVGPLLRRARDGPPQRSLRRVAREQGQRGAFRADGPVPAAVCLVDDVHTTGATLAACARALREGGARSVAAVTAARVPLHGDGGSRYRRPCPGRSQVRGAGNIVTRDR